MHKDGSLPTILMTGYFGTFPSPSLSYVIATMRDHIDARHSIDHVYERQHVVERLGPSVTEEFEEGIDNVSPHASRHSILLRDATES